MPAQDPDLTAEELATFLQDLDPGQHALVALAAMPAERALQACRHAAADAGERLVLIPGGATFRGLASLGADWPGVLAAVDAEANLASAGREAHLAAERATGTAGTHGARVVCLYTPAALARAGEDVARHHGAVLALGADPRVERLHGL